MPGIDHHLLDSDIVTLYTNVLNESVQLDRVNDFDIRSGIQEMKEAYKPKPLSLTIRKEEVAKARYNKPAYRCAYLHKYAACHTVLVCDMLRRAVIGNKDAFTAISSLHNRKICSLGGGPGTDVFAAIYVLSTAFGVHSYSVCIVDCMKEWVNTFDAMLRELRTGKYGSLSASVNPANFIYNYIGCDMLGPLRDDVKRAIAAADMVTMVKFISAASCCESQKMVKEIFNSMKLGALILFIDNAAGGFYELVAKTARAFKFETVFGPLRHEKYSNEVFRIWRYGYPSLCETRVAVQIWRKVTIHQSQLIHPNEQCQSILPHSLSKISCLSSSPNIDNSKANAFTNSQDKESGISPNKFSNSLRLGEKTEINSSIHKEIKPFKCNDAQYGTMLSSNDSMTQESWNARSKKSTFYSVYPSESNYVNIPFAANNCTTANNYTTVDNTTANKYTTANDYAAADIYTLRSQPLPISETGKKNYEIMQRQSLLPHSLSKVSYLSSSPNLDNSKANAFSNSQDKESCISANKFSNSLRLGEKTEINSSIRKEIRPFKCNDAQYGTMLSSNDSMAQESWNARSKKSTFYSVYPSDSNYVNNSVPSRANNYTPANNYTRVNNCRTANNYTTANNYVAAVNCTLRSQPLPVSEISSNSKKDYEISNSATEGCCSSCTIS